MASTVAQTSVLRGFDKQHSDPMEVPAPSLGTQLTRWLCGLQGHERYLHTDHDRVTLRCVGCGHESPGWSTGRRAYQTTYAGDAARHRLG